MSSDASGKFVFSTRASSEYWDSGNCSVSWRNDWYESREACWSR
jgi:hypothetical protein